MSRPLLKLSVFTVVTVVLTGVLASVIANVVLVPSRGYSAVFSDVTGLSKGDEVRVAGVVVGHVTSTGLTSDSRARVSFTVEKDVPLYADAHVNLLYRNLVGQRYLAVVEQPGGHLLAPGSTIPMSRTTPGLDLTALFQGFKPLFQALQPSQVNALAGEIVATLQGEGGTVRELLAHTAELTSTLADKDAVIGRVVSNLDDVLATVDQRDAKLGQLVDSFRGLVGGLARDKQVFSESLPELDELLVATNGLLAKAGPPLTADITALDSLTGKLDVTKGTLDAALHQLPVKLNALSRLASYGSWFNFYVCTASVRVSMLGRAISLTSPTTVTSDQAGSVCLQTAKDLRR